MFFSYQKCEAINATKILLNLLCSVLTSESKTITFAKDGEAKQQITVKMDEPSSIIQVRPWLSDYITKMPIKFGTLSSEFIDHHIVKPGQENKQLVENIEAIFTAILPQWADLRKTEYKNLFEHPENFFIFLSIINYFEPQQALQPKSNPAEQKDCFESKNSFIKNVRKFIELFYFQWLAQFDRSDRFVVAALRDKSDFYISQFYCAVTHDMKQAILTLAKKLGKQSPKLDFADLLPSLRNSEIDIQSRKGKKKDLTRTSLDSENALTKTVEKLNRYKSNRRNFLLDIAELYVYGGHRRNLPRILSFSFDPDSHKKVSAITHTISSHEGYYDDFRSIFPEQYFRYDATQKICLTELYSDEEIDCFYEVTKQIILNCVNLPTKRGLFKTALQAGAFGNAVLKLLECYKSDLGIPSFELFDDNFIRNTRSESDQYKSAAVDRLFAQEEFSTTVSSLQRHRKIVRDRRVSQDQEMTKITQHLVSSERMLETQKQAIWSRFAETTQSIFGQKLIKSFSVKNKDDSSVPVRSPIALDTWENILIAIKFIEASQDTNEILRCRNKWLQNDSSLKRAWKPPYYYTHDREGVAVQCSKIQAAVHRLAAIRVLILFTVNPHDRKFARECWSLLKCDNKESYFIKRKRRVLYGKPNQKFCTSYRYFDNGFFRDSYPKAVKSMLNECFGRIVREVYSDYKHDRFIFKDRP